MTDTTDSTTFNLDDYTYRLLESEPFFAVISRKINKSINRSVPTAGVRITEQGQFEMVYNPEFFEKLTPVQRTGTLKHELYHLIFDHVTGRLPPEGMAKMWDIASDWANSSHLIGELPEGGSVRHED